MVGAVALLGSAALARPRLALGAPAADAPSGWGAWQVFVGGPPAADEFLTPAALAVDGAGRVFVADAANFRVAVLSADGAPLGDVGLRGYGPGQFYEQLQGIAVDADGSVYVAESARIQKLTRAGRVLWLRRMDSEGAEAPVLGGSLAVDLNGHLYIGQASSGRIQVLDAGTGAVLAPLPVQVPSVRDLQVGSDGALWVLSGLGFVQIIDLPSGRSRTTISWPRDRADLDDQPGALAVADDDSFYVALNAVRQVRQYTIAGAEIGRTGPGDGRGGQAFGPTHALALDSGGRLFVGDGNRQRLVVYDTQHLEAGPVAIWGRAERGASRQLSGLGLAVDSNGVAYGARSGLDNAGQETSGIQRFAPDGTPLEVIASQPGLLTLPTGIALGAEGVLFVSHFEGRVAKLAPDGTPLDAFGGPWTQGDRQIERLQLPAAVAVGPASDLFVLDINPARVLRLSVDDGRLISAWDLDGPPGQRSALAVNADGLVFVSEHDQNRISAYTSTGALVTRFGGAGEEPGQLRGPSGIAVDQSGRLYVAETENQRVQALTTDGRSLGTWGGPGRAPGEFQTPIGLTLGGDGALYVMDSGNLRIQRLPRVA